MSLAACPETHQPKLRWCISFIDKDLSLEMRCYQSPTCLNKWLLTWEVQPVGYKERGDSNLLGVVNYQSFSLGLIFIRTRIGQNTFWWNHFLLESAVLLKLNRFLKLSIFTKFLFWGGWKLTFRNQTLKFFVLKQGFISKFFNVFSMYYNIHF